MNELTPAHCKEFDGYVLKWQRLLNLTDWRIERSARRSKKNMAEVVIDIDARMASYSVGLSFGATPVTPESLEATALHELLHIFLYELAPKSPERAQHRVIHLLEKLLMERQ